VLIIATSVVYQQMQFAKSERLGYNKDQMLTLKMPSVLNQQYDAFRNKLITKPGVKNVVASSGMPTEHLGDMFALQIDGADFQMYYYLSVEQEFLDAYEVNFLAGQNFSRDRTIDRVEVPTEEKPITYARMVVNESFIKLRGWTPEQAIDKNVDIQITENPREPLIKTTVIGVISDLKFNSVRELNRPAVYAVLPWTYSRVSIKVKASEVSSAMASVQSVWQEFLPNEPMEAQFLDVRFDALYHSEKQLSQLFTLFAIIAISISCLGLYGLVAFATERRKKEISIRQVLGADGFIINKLFLKEFVTLVLIANVIGWPVAYMLMRDWLNGFAYRIDISPLIFVVSTLLTLIIATATVLLQVQFALKENTAESLRSD
jgi:putative ABC transport system permease protein